MTGSTGYKQIIGNHSPHCKVAKSAKEYMK